MMIIKYIEELENDNSRLAKEDVLEQAWVNGCTELFEGFRLAYDSMITFGVKKVPEIVELDDAPGEFNWVDFLHLAEQLRTRRLTGNAARDALREAAEKSNVLLWNKFYRRILLKDLRCGVSSKTVNKVLKKLGKTDKKALGYIIEEFEVQLATAEELANIAGEQFLDPKLDGVRITTVLDKENNDITLYTRNGKINYNFNHVESSLRNILERIPTSIVLDGEMVSRSFQDLMKQVNRKKTVDTLDARYAVFDILPLADFKKGICKMPLEERNEILVAMDAMFQEFCRIQQKSGVEIANVYVIPKLLVDLNTEEGRRNMNEFNLQTLEAGYEGIMVKSPKSFYERKRNKNWLKVKPVIQVSLRVDNIEEGTGRNVGRMGNINCSGNDMGYPIRVSVGSGFSDKEREEFWLYRDQLPGQIIEIEADAITKDQSDDDWYSLRFPRFKTFRGFVPGEKL
jgi:DNA ligase-1